jgi:hypothetical protein
MTNEQIEKFLATQQHDVTSVQISFKTRKPIVGRFIMTKDYSELKSKNFWRVIGETHFEQYKQSNDVNLARIYSGTEFTKLGLQK